MKKLNFSPISRLLITATLALPFTAFADTATPTQCPDVAAIKAAGLAFTQMDDQDNAFIATAIGKFGTEVTWGFGILVPYNQAVDAQDAMNKATASLPTLSGAPEPFQDENGQFYCMYNNIYGYPSGALTPLNLG